MPSRLPRSASTTPGHNERGGRPAAASTLVEEALTSVVHTQLEDMRRLQAEKAEYEDYRKNIILHDLLGEVCTSLLAVSGPWGHRPNRLSCAARYAIWLTLTVGKLALLMALLRAALLHFVLPHVPTVERYEIQHLLGIAVAPAPPIRKGRNAPVDGANGPWAL